MSGPIVRSGPNEKFTSNWDQVFGGKKSAAKPAKGAKKKAPAAKAKKSKKK